MLRLLPDASREVDDVVTGLRELNVSAQDIVALLRSRPLRAEPHRPLVVPNTEIAARGLACRPDVIAVQWEDRGFGITTYCRNCVEEDQSAWRDLPHGTSAVLYEGPVNCDVCYATVDRDPSGRAIVRHTQAAYTELAQHGLDRHPEVLAVWWAIPGVGVRTWCRQCVNENRATWCDLPPGTAGLIYDGPVQCERCHADDDGSGVNP